MKLLKKKNVFHVSLELHTLQGIEMWYLELAYLTQAGSGEARDAGMISWAVAQGTGRVAASKQSKIIGGGVCL